MRATFASIHNYLDPSSGAAISMRTTLRSLAKLGVKTRVFCGNCFDFDRYDDAALPSLLKQCCGSCRVKKCAVALGSRKYDFRLFEFDDDGIEGTVYQPCETYSLASPHTVSSDALNVFYRLLDAELERTSPDIFAAYGGDPLLEASAARAKKLGGKTVFFLHNLAYRNRGHFQNFDSVVVPSDYAKAYYKKELGLDCVVIPPAIEEEKVVAENLSKRYATFINPALEKGRSFFTGIARDVHAISPEIPFLVINARSTAQTLGFSAEGRELTNIDFLPTVSESKRIYALSRLVLVPSVCSESFGRVVVESGLNGILCLCSDRGALPEVVGDEGLLVGIPEVYVNDRSLIPSTTDTKDWVERILKIWNNSAYAAELGVRLKNRCLRYSLKCVEESTLRLFNEFAKF